MGDFNVKIGVGNISYIEVMGIYGFGKINESGEIDIFWYLCFL